MVGELFMKTVNEFIKDLQKIRFKVIDEYDSLNKSESNIESVVIYYE